MKKQFATAFAGLFLLAGTAWAQDEESARNPVEADEEARDERSAEEIERGQEVICRRERVTGSLTRVNRICMTRDEWNGVSDSTRESMNTVNRRAAGGADCRQDMFGGCSVSGAGQDFGGVSGF